MCRFAQQKMSTKEPIKQNAVIHKVINNIIGKVCNGLETAGGTVPSLDESPQTPFG